MASNTSFSLHDEKVFSVAPAKVYNRASIPEDEVIEPYELKGLRRSVFLTLYSMILITAIVGLAYTFYFNPFFGLVALVIGYFFDNLAFGCGHLEFHTEFIEMREKKMTTLCHNSLIKHYRNKHVFHERWLETRMSYFIDPQTVVTAGSILKVLAALLILGALSHFTHPALAIAWYSAQAVPALIQATIHEWYHNPPHNRKTFYCLPAYLFFIFLEKTSLASTSGHNIHHQHGLNNLNQVHRWLDLYIPFGEIQPTQFWKKALALYEPGKTNMTDFAKRGAPFKFLVGYRLFAVVAVTAAYYLIVR